MTTIDVIELNEKLIKAWNDHDVEKMVSLFDAEFIWRDIAVPEAFKGKEGAKKFFNMWHTAFPDFRIKVVGAIADENGIALETEFSGTNTGQLQLGESMAIPATNKQVIASRGVYFAWARNGKFYKIYTYPDVVNMMAQLGLTHEVQV